MTADMKTLRQVAHRRQETASHISTYGNSSEYESHTTRTMSYRAARDVVTAACRKAGLPTVHASELRSACAYWLHVQGLSAHEVAAVLGVARVRTVDRLLERHLSLDAQRRVRNLLSE